MKYTKYKRKKEHKSFNILTKKRKRTKANNLLMRTKKQSFKNIPDNESIKENSNIKKKYKKILRDLSIANQTIFTLKRKLNEKERNNNYNNFNNNIESNPMNITAIYNTKKYNKSYARTTINLFRDYKEYIDKKNYLELNPNKNTMNNYK